MIFDKKQPSKVVQAQSYASNALGLFQDAHDDLQTSVDLLTEAADEHEQERVFQEDQRDKALALLAEHEASRQKLAEFLPGVK